MHLCFSFLFNLLMFIFGMCIFLRYIKILLNHILCENIFAKNILNDY